MIIVRLIGGLGNQMFQYAFGLSLAKKRNTVLKLDLSGYGARGSLHLTPRQYALDIFNLSPEFATRLEASRFQRYFPYRPLDVAIRQFLGPKKSYILEKQFHFSPEIADSPDNVLLQGYWQSFRYFENVYNELANAFTFKEAVSINAAPLLNRIQANTNSVCVHVRRGDFLTNTNHGFLGLDYYKKAALAMREKIAEPEWYVFSDDIGWCRENMGFLEGAEFVSQELAGTKDQDHLRLMSACTHFIIANSSFAWWSVWLNKIEDKNVIAPGFWVKNATTTSDIHLKNWIIIK